MSVDDAWAPKTPTEGVIVDPDVAGPLRQLREWGRRRWGEDFVDLGRSEPLPARPVDPGIIEAGWRAASWYPPIGGSSDARAAVAERLSASGGPEITGDEVVLVPGGVAGLFVTFAAVMTAGDEVVVPRPFYRPHVLQPSVLGGTVRCVDTALTQWHLVPESLREVVTSRTRAILLSNPTNPTGAVIRRSEIEAILEQIQPGVVVIADEVYADFVYDGTFTPTRAVVDPSRNPVITLMSLSKSSAVPGLRAGALVAPRDMVPRLVAMASCLTGPCNAIGQEVLGALPSQSIESHTAPLRPRLRDVVEIVADSAFAVVSPEGTYYVWIKTPVRDTLGFVGDLVDQVGVFAWPGEYFGVSGYLRVSLSLSRERLRDGLRRMLQVEASGATLLRQVGR